MELHLGMNPTRRRREEEWLWAFARIRPFEEAGPDLMPSDAYRSRAEAICAAEALHREACGSDAPKLAWAVNPTEPEIVYAESESDGSYYHVFPLKVVEGCE